MFPSPAIKSQLIRERLPALMEKLDPCRLCPRLCLSHRSQGETGECRIGDTVLISTIGLHRGEEFPISGLYGSGTIFLSGCNLHCVFCQNWTISQSADGAPCKARDLARAMLTLQRSGAHNINWVSPTHVLPMLLDALQLAYEDGLGIPLVYNTGGYDNVEVIELLDGIVDIYMPDMKYGDSETAKMFSDVDDYVTYNQRIVQEMYRQVGPLVLDQIGAATRGLLVRHLVLPNNLANSDAIFRFLDESLPGYVDINIMDQYRPCHQAYRFPALQRRIMDEEYQRALELARSKPSLRIIE